MAQRQTLGIGGLAYKSTNDLSGTASDVTNGNAIGTTYKNGIGMAVIADTANEGSVILAGANARILGVLENNPKAAEAATIQSARGSSAKVLVGGVVAKGDFLETDASGRFVTSTIANHKINAQAMQASTGAGDLVEAVLLDDIHA